MSICYKLFTRVSLLYVAIQGNDITHHSGDTTGTLTRYDVGISWADGTDRPLARCLPADDELREARTVRRRDEGVEAAAVQLPARWPTEHCRTVYKWA